MELFRLEKIFGIIKSGVHPPPPQSPPSHGLRSHFHGFWTIPGTVTPPLPRAVFASPFQEQFVPDFQLEPPLVLPEAVPSCPAAC